MQEFTLDFDTIERPKHIVYGGFWSRLWASLLDFLILSPLTVFLTFYNIFYWKSFGIHILITFISLIYKPLLEVRFGATYGKMAAKLKVVNSRFETSDFKDILLRNLIYIVLPLIYLPDIYATFNTPGFKDFSNFTGYMVFTQKNPGNKYIIYLNYLIVTIDIIFLLANNKRQSLHDKIGGTYVIKN